MEPRSATARDVPAIEALVTAAFARYLPRMDRKPAPMLEDHAALVAAGLVRVIGRGEAVEGAMVLCDRHDHLLIDMVAVAPAAQGAGLGRRLIAAAEQEARHRGRPLLRLCTNVAMVENLALYRHLGFVETHRGLENGYHRVYLEKRLV